MKHLLNSAVLTGPGEYSYRLIAREEAVSWIRGGGWVSRIGYPATAGHIQAISGIRPTLSREMTKMQAGDEALVIRLAYRIQEPEKKAGFQPGEQDWEYGILYKKS